MWDMITGMQVAVGPFRILYECLLIPHVRFQNLTSCEYRSFMFLDHRWVLFGASPDGPTRDADLAGYPFLEIIDPTCPTYTTRLELDKSVLRRTSAYANVEISVGGSEGFEGSTLTRVGDIPFASEVSRGIISAVVYCCNRDPGGIDNPPFGEAFVFILNVEDILSKVPSPPNLEQYHLKWEDLSPSAATFSYASMDEDDRYMISSKHSCVTGFRYISPIQPLYPEDPMGPRRFFVYDFNPHRGTSGPLPGAVPEDLDPETGYNKSASEITREVVGGLGCWKMRFDLPAAGGDIQQCHVGLADGGFLLFEVRYLMSSCGWFDSDMRSLKGESYGRGNHYGFLCLVICRWNFYSWGRGCFFGVGWDKRCRLGFLYYRFVSPHNLEKSLTISQSDSSVVVVTLVLVGNSAVNLE